MSLDRRGFLLASGVVALSGCAPREPETPLAHLHGKEWVHGAYGHYAQTYLTLHDRAQKKSFDAYRHLAQKGIGALEGLQSREVPFYVRVAPDSSSFRVERDVPERLTFTADMTPEDREHATRAWKLAREHVHTDYAEIQRLDVAMTTLVAEVARIRNAIDEGRIEQFRIVRQLGGLRDNREPPFKLPYQVTRDDYRTVLLLLLERLETDRERMRHTESAMIAVGLVSRATDAGSASLADNVKKVLLAVRDDAERNSAAPPPRYPESSERVDELVTRAKVLEARIAAGDDYRRWLAIQQEQEDAIGKLLVIVDSLTGLPMSTVYKQVMRVWRGGGDYLDYLKIAVAIVPQGSHVSGVLGDGIATTEKYRGAVQSAGDARALGRTLVERSDGGAAELADVALVNVGSELARRRLNKQLAFFRTAEEAKQAAEELDGSPFAR